MAKGAYIGINTAVPASDSLNAKSVGSIVKLNENGSPAEYIIIHQGNPYKHIYDSSCDGTWLLRKDIYAESKWNNTSDNTYSSSLIHKYINSTFLDTLDTNVKSQIKTVKIPYVNGDGGSPVKSGVDGLSTQVFLLSGYELGYSIYDDEYFPEDGVKLSYFESGASDSAKSKRIANYNGTATRWALRSPYSGNSSYPYYIGTNGATGRGLMATNTFGVRPALILPNTCKVNSNGLVTGETSTTTKGIARKIIKGYIGIDGVARKIKKAYIGIGGVARPCWSSKGVEYYGEITSLVKAKRQLAATTVGGYALFGGGVYNSTSQKTVDAYNSTLTKSSPTSLASARHFLAATTIGNYALFAGGTSSTMGTGGDSTVDAYDTSLTHSTPTELSIGRYALAATTVGNYALFAGGMRVKSEFLGLNPGNEVDAYDTSLTRYSISQGLFWGSANLAATTVGAYALFSGGSDGASNNYEKVTAYNTSLTYSNVGDLKYSRCSHVAITLGNFAVFAGGSTDVSGAGDTVEVYDSSLIHFMAPNMSSVRYRFAAASLGDYALFGGGLFVAKVNQSNESNTVDVYDKSLTASIATNLARTRYYHAATTIGNYVLFGGGESQESDTATVEAYVVT